MTYRNVQILIASALLSAAAVVCAAPGSATPFKRMSIVHAPYVTTTPTPVAYLTTYYQMGTGYISQIDSFNTATNKFTGTLAKMNGLVEGASLSRDGKELYMTLPIVTGGNPNQTGNVDAFSITPTSATLTGGTTFPSGSFGIAFAGMTNEPGANGIAELFTDRSSGAALTIDTYTLKTVVRGGPSLSSAVEYAVVAPGTGVQNSYILTQSGIFTVYNAGTNSYLPHTITGITNGLGVSTPTVAVPPSGSPVYALTTNGSNLTDIDEINPGSVTVTKKIAIGLPCFEVIPAPNSANIYALCEQKVNNMPVYSVYTINVGSNLVTKAFAVPDKTIMIEPSMAVSPDGANLLITAGNGSGSATIDVVNATTGALVAKVAVPPVGSTIIQASQIFTAP